MLVCAAVRGVQHLDGVRMAPEARVQEVREAVEEERRWFEFGWWQGFRRCEERIYASLVALSALLLRLQYVSPSSPPLSCMLSLLSFFFLSHSQLTSLPRM